MLPSRLLLVRQNFPDLRLGDVRAETRSQLEHSNFAARLRPGARVAIGVGSRGIANIATIVQSTVQYWRDHGMVPFVFPSMGSHGAATAEGQAGVLAHFGITEQSMGCPIVSRLDVVSLGETGDGIEVFMDAAAHEADGVMIVARVKWHTTLNGRLESGLMRWVAATAGKMDSAQVTYGWIRNTLELDRLAISPNLRGDIDAQPQVEVDGEIDVKWDERGNLVSPFCLAH